MEAFKVSYTLLFTKNHIERDLLLSSMSLLRPRSDFTCFRVKIINAGVYRSVPLNRPPIHVVSSWKLEGLEIEDDAMKRFEPSKKVRVKFQLQKECMFGEQFLLVGDYPALGSWNLSSAIPLNWSDGHTWTVEMDILVGMSVQFKFILRQITGVILWQPGPDRLIQTWETDNTILVAEDWENAEVQKITELSLKQPMIHQDLMEPVVTSDLPHLREDLVPNVGNDFTIADELAYIKGKAMKRNNSEGPLIIAEEKLFIVDGVNYHEQAMSRQNVRTKQIKSEDTSPLLVPGLPISTDVSTEDLGDFSG